MFQELVMLFSTRQALAQEWCQICLPCRLKRSPFDFNNDAHVAISESMHDLAIADSFRTGGRVYDIGMCVCWKDCH
jgi:hypothetical protein